MENNKMIECAKKLVNIAIEQHNQGLLGKEKISLFFKKNLEIDESKNNYNIIICYFCTFLAREGYEILDDVNHFDIIDYNSSEYDDYCNKMLEDLPKNFDYLLKISKKIALRIIELYHNDITFVNKNFDYYFKYVLSEIKYTSKKDRMIIYVNTVDYITSEHYDLKSINPLKLEEF